MPRVKITPMKADRLTPPGKKMLSQGGKTSLYYSHVTPEEPTEEEMSGGIPGYVGDGEVLSHTSGMNTCDIHPAPSEHRMVTAARTCKPNGGVKKKRRHRNGVRALSDIRKYQRSTELLIRKLPYQRFVRQIASEFRADLRWTGSALLALHEASEQFLTTLFSQSQRCALHAGRVLVKPEDMKLAVALTADPQQ
jgi:histone H3